MKSNKKQNNVEKSKKDIWKQLERTYRNSVKTAKDILKKMKSYHFYEAKDGWDNEPEPITGSVSEEMTPEEIFVWIYENDVNPRNMVSPYIYTDEEIDSFRKNRSMMKIEEIKRSINFYKEQIHKYENRIKDIQTNISKEK